MVEIVPFRGVTYPLEELADHGALLTAPPYDVISPAERLSFYQRHPHNILHVDLGPERADDPEPYTWHRRSLEILKQWLVQGVLVRRPEKALFHMETRSFDLESGRPIVRHGLVCLMRLDEFGPGAMVKPHEKTFSRHKEERLSLMKNTASQLSQVFGFFSDPDKQALRLMKFDRKPDVDFTDAQNLAHKVWINEDERLIAQLQNMLADRKVYIADGHHRYETALNYRCWLAGNGRLAPDHPANYVMTYLSPDSDDGLYTLPTHRLLGRLNHSHDELLRLLGEYFVVDEFPVAPGQAPEARRAFLEALAKGHGEGRNCFGLYLENRPLLYLLTLRGQIGQTPVLQDAPPALAAVDTFLLTNLAFQKIMGFTEQDLDDPDLIAYMPLAEAALNEVEAGRRKAAFILNPTPLSQLIDVAEIDLVMPRKSTYFYPKVATGLVLNLGFQEVIS